ncbi:aminotransferase class I/II-fold pyridoxal phosphate-dependent enzyme [Vibrio sp. S9_S30]|uniref:DegT/DnrJ/EryC1/StrS family aminotransferase n=1 Tax=Vibrio sp. S9_S30 TaxID=2720226 RepID=UPI001680E2FC|nr:aminotransferase class I/II-fold pyridoxal phosphate-dependent enzyme [Vibrio sp. S9_S30]MBD1559286.1 aminotransferase class I/II-fold pyridoxal phosphate-dependent enzyme [Vibrio sp. S9_S30]
MQKFEKSFTQQEAIPEKAIQCAEKVLRSGRLHRYNSDVGGEPTETELLELEFAHYVGSRFCLSCASGGYALHIALLSVGLKLGDKVLCNAFTLAPVPGAITNAGGVPVLVETTDDYTIDLDDLAQKAQQEDVKFLMLSHMRGHLADMNKLMTICEANHVTVIEDCAHTMGAKWDGVHSGRFGKVACYSTQTYKHLNSGEGGLLTTDDETVMAKAIIYSGSYMLYERHLAAPRAEAFEGIDTATPNFSGRMDNLRAAILRPQLQDIDEQCAQWNRRYALLEDALCDIEGMRFPRRPPQEAFVGSSIQFNLVNQSADFIREFVVRCEALGVVLKWFGDAKPKGYTSQYQSWAYLDTSAELPNTDRVLATMLDMRIPLTFDESDCTQIAEIIRYVWEDMNQRAC